MDLLAEESGGVVCLTCVGDIDAGSVHVLRAGLDRLISEGRHRFVVDLARVPFMDSSGLAALVQLFKRVRIGEGDVRLAALQPPVLHIFELVRLTRVFEIFPTSQDAVDSYAEAGSRAGR